MRKPITKEELVDRLEALVDKAGSQVAFAAQHRLAPSYINMVLSGRQDPGPAILDALGLEKVVAYRPRQEVP